MKKTDIIVDKHRRRPSDDDYVYPAELLHTCEICVHVIDIMSAQFLDWLH